MESVVKPKPKPQHTTNFVKNSSFVKSDDPALRQAVEGAQIFADTILQSRFTNAEKEMFAGVIRRFNELWWEMGIQTWSSLKYRGVNCLKPPTDMWVYQELIYTLRPDVIIETGTFAGGSALYMRDIMDLMGVRGKVITIDCDISKLHPTFNQSCIDHYCEEDYHKNGLVMLHGLSTDLRVVEILKGYLNPDDRVMVILDSDHSYENVTKELEIYAPLVTLGSCLIVEDTSNTESAKQANNDWYFDHRKEFQRDVMCEKLMLTFNRDGFYERIG